jgi:ribosomal protein S3
MTDKVQIDNEKIANDFGMYFFDKSPKETVIEKSKEATIKLQEMGIMDFGLFNGNLIVTLRWPGLLIGQYGSTINSLTEYLKGKSKVNDYFFDRISIREYKNKILDAIFNFQYIPDFCY